jgi:hypothetical protein
MIFRQAKHKRDNQNEITLSTRARNVLWFSSHSHHFRVSYTNKEVFLVHDKMSIKRRQKMGLITKELCNMARLHRRRTRKTILLRRITISLSQGDLEHWQSENITQSIKETKCQHKTFDLLVTRYLGDKNWHDCKNASR